MTEIVITLGKGEGKKLDTNAKQTTNSLAPNQR